MNTPCRRSVLITLALLTAVPAAADDLRLELDPETVRTEAGGDGGRTVRSWNWGVLVTAAGLKPVSTTDALVVPLVGEITVHGPRDAKGRAPLTLLAEGLVLTVDGDASFRSRDGVTEVGPPESAMDPRAAVGIFLAMLILTALMIRQTRRSLAGR